MLATLQSRVNAEWRVTARYTREEKSCVNEDRETSVIGKELYKSLEAWWNTNGFVITTLRARLKIKSNIVLVYLDKALAYVYGVISKIIDGVTASFSEQRAIIFGVVCTV